MRLNATYRGLKYTFNGKSWLDANYLVVPVKLSAELDRRFRGVGHQKTTELMTSVMKSRHQAVSSGDKATLCRVRKEVTEVLRRDPAHPFAAAILCSVLRALELPSRAIAETNKYLRPGASALLTSRAAAFCDLGRWDEARISIRKAQSRGTSPEAMAVYRRIRKARPDLCA